MSTFGLDTTSSTQNIVDAINYAISNLGQGGSANFNGNVLTANTGTGQITTTTTNAAGYSNTSVISYLYQFMDVAYANTATGGGFTSNCRNTQYFGLHNTNSTTIDTNPSDYIWYQVTGGFGTTKNLWYQTTGGRQVAFFAGNAAPAPNYIPVPDSTPLNLDSITSVQNNQIVNVNAYYQANTAPATPSGGTYNFSTFTLTPPSGWSASIPSTNSNTTVYVSQAAFVGNSISTVGPSTLWTTPAAYIQQFQGNTGPAGQRGFIPMGYVICSTDPAFFSNPSDYTTAFSAARTNASPPIGLGFAPIANDTAQFFYANLFSGVDTTTVRQFNGNIWINVDAQVISGGLFVPGTITANTLNANEVYALTVTGGNVTPGINSGYGYWLTANVGNAYFGGTVDIGNNLIVGQNAQFGSNLNIGDSLTIANNASIGNNLSVGTNATIGGVIIGGILAPATVGNSQIVANSLNGNFAILDGSIGTTKIGNNAISTGQIQANAITANQISAGSIYAGAIQANAITAGTIAANAITSYSLQVNSVTAGKIAANAVTAGTIAANTITGNLVQANTIQGASIVAGSITSTQLSANIIIAGNIISFGQTIESPTGTGYWLDYTNGNVYFGGNTVIGNRLKIGNNPNIGTGLVVGDSASIGANLVVGINANIGSNLIVGTNATIGVNLIVGQNAQIGANLNIGSSLVVGTNATIGTNLTVQDNATIGNNLQVGTNATIGGVIIGGVLGAGTVGNTQVASGLNGGLIAGGTIGSTQIGSNAIITSKIAANAITATQIAAGSIYAGAIQAGAVVAGTIAAGAIQANAIQANAVVAGTIAAGAISAYSLQANSITAGSIAANAVTSGTIAANTITGYEIQTNTITTTNLVFNSATGYVSLGPLYTGNYPVPFYNLPGQGAIGSSNYLWPYYTRGFAQGYGLSFVPDFSGNTVTNQRLILDYSASIFSANAANVVELWKSGGSSYYNENYLCIRCNPPVGTSLPNDVFYMGGINGYIGYSFGGAAPGTWITERTISSLTGYNNSMPLESCIGFYSSSTNTEVYTTISGIEFAINGNTQTVSTGGNVANVATQYGSAISIGLSVASGIPQTLTVGQNGAVYQIYNTGIFQTPQALESTGIVSTLFGVDFGQGPLNTTSSNVPAVAVGSNGTILRNTYTKASQQATGTGWVQKNSGIITNLNAVRSNWSSFTDTATQWVAVGDMGVILYSSDGNTWSQAVSPTTQQLLGVTYGNGRWVAVGALSTIVYSSDGINWTATQGPKGNNNVYRTLNSVTYGQQNNYFVASGEAIVMRASAASAPTTWSTSYDAGVSTQSNYTLLVSYGANGANVANVTLPASNQLLGTTQNVSGQYVDYNFTANTTVTYYLVMGNLTGNSVTANNPTLQITEFKR